MSSFSEFAIRNELLNFVRNQNIISTGNRGVTSVTGETQSGDGSTIIFTLNNTGVKNISEVRLTGTPLTYGEDWDISATSTEWKVIVYNSVSGTDNYAIDYDYSSSGDLIYDDYPRPDLALSNFNNGRIGFDIISTVTDDIAIAGETTNTNFLVQFTLYARDKYTIGDMMDKIRDAFNQNKKSFYRFPYTIPTATNNLSTSDTPDDKVIQRNFSIKIPYLFESN